ncbi:hypothetical protein ACHAW6_009195 [Cyclotella cf. meneghiniana]
MTPLFLAAMMMLASLRHCSALTRESWRCAFPPNNRNRCSCPMTMSVSSYALRSNKPLRPLVVCGPSGVGKGTIISKFMEESARSTNLPKFGFSVSHTTRQPRPGEVNGVHYHFVSREFFDEKVASGNFFIEYAEVHGNMYGTSYNAIFDVTKCCDNESAIQRIGGFTETQCLLDIDVEGVKSIKEFQIRQPMRMSTEPTLGKSKSTQQYLMNNIQELPLLRAKFIFIAPPSIDTLRERLQNRGTETPETLERRFQNAKGELEYGMEPGNFDAIIVNDNLEQACSDFTTAVMDMYLVRE